MATSLVGTWRLLSFQMELMDTGERTEPYGADPCGRAVLTDGHMMALITAPNRPAPTDQAGMAAAFGTLLAYSGAYRIDGDRLVTDCDLAWSRPGLARSRCARLCSMAIGWYSSHRRRHIPAIPAARCAACSPGNARPERRG